MLIYNKEIEKNNKNLATKCFRCEFQYTSGNKRYVHKLLQINRDLMGFFEVFLIAFIFIVNLK